MPSCKVHVLRTYHPEFNDLVNMTADELKDWLQQSSSEEAGWSKDDGSGESVGHESGRKIIAILEKNPKKDPSKYDDEDLQHMRKVVSYNKRHLAQEGKAKQDPDSRSARRRTQECELVLTRSRYDHLQFRLQRPSDRNTLDREQGFGALLSNHKPPVLRLLCRVEWSVDGEIRLSRPRSRSRDLQPQS
ncbi:hypothetical protein KC349_g69 [Hortaea werneckii]|nr:hypothetical protein KC349_g69 [Hortaea werneckii]